MRDAIPENVTAPPARLLSARTVYSCMPVRTKRWNDPRERDDGFRLLVCRLRPRGVAKARETWDEWWPDLGPSRELLDAFHGKGRAAPLPWDEYVPRYLDEMRAPGAIFR